MTTDNLRDLAEEAMRKVDSQDALCKLIYEEQTSCEDNLADIISVTDECLPSPLSILRNAMDDFQEYEDTFYPDIEPVDEVKRYATAEFEEASIKAQRVADAFRDLNTCLLTVDDLAADLEREVDSYVSAMVSLNSKLESVAETEDDRLTNLNGVYIGLTKAVTAMGKQEAADIINEHLSTTDKPQARRVDAIQ